jgi:hypothetical protein
MKVQSVADSRVQGVYSLEHTRSDSALPHQCQHQSVLVMFLVQSGDTTFFEVCERLTI